MVHAPCYISPFTVRWEYSCGGGGNTFSYDLKGVRGPTYMRNIKRQMQDVWFCNFTEENDGLDTVKTYDKPIKKRFSVSGTSGTVYGWGAGLSLSYDRYITSFDRNFRPKEGMMVFVDVIPDLDKNGNLVKNRITESDLDGTIVSYEEYSTEPDYMIEKIYDTKRGKVARYAIKKV